MSVISCVLDADGELISYTGKQHFCDRRRCVALCLLSTPASARRVAHTSLAGCSRPSDSSRPVTVLARDQIVTSRRRLSEDS